MAGTFSYKIRTSNSGRPTVHVSYSYGRNKWFRKTTGISFHNAKNWTEKERIKEVIEEDGAKKKNERLDIIERYFSKEVETLLNNNEALDNKILGEILKSCPENLNETKKRKAFNLKEELDSWIDYSENKKRTKSGTKLSKGTVKSLKNTAVVLLEFEKNYSNLSPSKVNTSLYEELLSFLESKKYSLNYIGKVIKNTKVFLKHVEKSSSYQFKNYTPEEWIIHKEEVNEIYLNTNELMTLYHLDLSKLHQDYATARDLFLISAFTGLRISDNKRLSSENIKTIEGMRFFTIKSQKTKEEVVIPISQVVESILERNNGFPKKLTDQRINKLIKEIGEYAGIDESITMRKTIGGKTTENSYCKFELIKTHTARRSFCTNAYLGGLDSLSIMAVSGHKTEENFLNYIKVTKEQQALRTANHQYFKSLSPNNFETPNNTILKAL